MNKPPMSLPTESRPKCNCLESGSFNNSRCPQHRPGWITENEPLSVPVESRLHFEDLQTLAKLITRMGYISECNERQMVDLMGKALEDERREPVPAYSSLLPVPEPEVQRDNNRCAICAWPLIEGDGLNPLGCVRGNCSLRPHPEKFYDFDRAEREYGIKFDSKYRAGLPSRSPTGATRK